MLSEVAVARVSQTLAAEQLFQFGPQITLLSIRFPSISERGRAGLMLTSGAVCKCWRTEGGVRIVIIDLRNHRCCGKFCLPPPFCRPDGLILPLTSRSQPPCHPGGLPSFVYVYVTRFCFDVIEPCVFHPFTSGSTDVFTGDGAGVTANTFIEIQYHPNL